MERMKDENELVNNHIHYLDNAASVWDNASPIGCGAAGAMIYGGVETERLALNEETIWNGNPIDTKCGDFAERIAYIRKLLLEGKDYEAEQWVFENMQDNFHRVKSYEYAGEIHVKMHEDDRCTDYRREIDLLHGVCSVAYKKEDVAYRREYFASYPRQLICAKYTAEEKFTAVISYHRENIVDCRISENGIAAKGHTADGNHEFKVCIQLKTDGQAAVEENSIVVRDASCVEFYTGIFTDIKCPDLSSAGLCGTEGTAADWEMMLAEHQKDFAELMGRSSINLEYDRTLDKLPIPQRLERLKEDEQASDLGLINLYWQFGKYLLVSSSRPGTLPANLQGVWADGLKSPWNADYHTNINLQMNYWHAEQANISECTQALFDYMNNNLLPGGKKMARENYGTGGMVVHHLSDIYQFAAVADGPWGLWPVGGAWLCYHMWEHYLYTQDREFLRDVAYDFIRENAQFWIENLFEDQDGVLHTGPSTSPENRFLMEVNGESKTGYITKSPTMDVEIVGGLLEFYAECENILEIDPAYGKLALEKRSKMLPLRIGKHGQLMEWYKDYEEAEPGHRHISHAFALYPAAQITRKTPELLKAIEVTMKRRLASGGGHTGWSRAWLINLFARLRNGEKTYENIRTLFTKSTLPNLFDTHPPFQIDGNFGGSAGIGEMLMQSHEGCISILPAAAKCMENGSFTGLRARGGITVSAWWKEGRVIKVELKADAPTAVKLELPGRDVMEVNVADQIVCLDFNKCLLFDGIGEQVYESKMCK